MKDPERLALWLLAALVLFLLVFLVPRACGQDTETEHRLTTIEVQGQATIAAIQELNEYMNSDREVSADWRARIETKVAWMLGGASFLLTMLLADAIHRRWKGER